MLAIGLTDLASGLRALELERPVPADDEVLVRVCATSINPIDVLVATGRYRAGNFEFPLVPGWDFAGIVADTGKQVHRVRTGDRVFGYWSRPVFHAGAWAEYLTVPQDGVIAEMPTDLDMLDAAALPLAAVTALVAIEDVAVASGEVVLVVGAGGAVGAYTVQLAAARGAHVVATAKGRDRARLESLGAKEVFDYAEPDHRRTVAERWAGRVDSLVDIVNDRSAVREWAGLVRDGGKVASARFAADAHAMASRGIAVANVNAHDCGFEVMDRLTSLVSAGGIIALRDDVRPFGELPDAVASFARGGQGKIVIEVRPA